MIIILRISVTRRAMLEGALAPGSATHAKLLEEYKPDEVEIWSYRLGAVRGANNLNPKKFSVTNPPELMGETKNHTGF
jgi:hypothetical protein